MGGCEFTGIGLRGAGVGPGFEGVQLAPPGLLQFGDEEICAVILAHWPKGQLAFAGYADPASALETALCAMSRGDINLPAASVTPEAKRRMTREDWVGVEHGSPADEIAASTRSIADSLSPSGAFYLVSQKLTPPDQAILDVYLGGEGNTRKFVLEKIGA